MLIKVYKNPPRALSVNSRRGKKGIVSIGYFDSEKRKHENKKQVKNPPKPKTYNTRTHYHSKHRRHVCLTKYRLKPTRNTTLHNFFSKKDKIRTNDEDCKCENERKIREPSKNKHKNCYRVSVRDKIRKTGKELRTKWNLNLMSQNDTDEHLKNTGKKILFSS